MKVMNFFFWWTSGIFFKMSGYNRHHAHNTWFRGELTKITYYIDYPQIILLTSTTLISPVTLSKQDKSDSSSSWALLKTFLLDEDLDLGSVSFIIGRHFRRKDMPPCYM